MQKNEIKILVVDDDKEIVDIIRQHLQEAGYVPVLAYNGESALRALDRADISLIIMDVMMPKLNGLMATMKIREKSNVPILILSAKSEMEDRVIGLSMGADDYLVKPFYKEELLARVQAQLRRYKLLGGATAEKQEENIVNYHDILLDKEKREVIVRGKQVSLTFTEYKILELFLCRPGKVFTAEEIYQAVWDNDSYAVENTVMIHISRLRKKIELNPKQPEYLKVVWGVGYKLEK